MAQSEDYCPPLKRQNAVSSADEAKFEVIVSLGYWYTEAVMEVFQSRKAGVKALTGQLKDPVVVNLIRLVEKSYERTESEVEVYLANIHSIADAEQVFKALVVDSIGQEINWPRLVSVVCVGVIMMKFLQKFGRAKLAKAWVGDFLAENCVRFVKSQAGGYDGVIAYAQSRLN